LLCIADNTETKFQISKSMIVTGGSVVTVCIVILLHEARVVVVWTAALVLWCLGWGPFLGPRTSRVFV